MTDYKTCIDCGKPFKRSRTDKTVRCMDCRAAKRAKADAAAAKRIADAKAREADAIYIRMGEIRRAARAAGVGTPEYEAGIAEFAKLAEYRRALLAASA